MTVFTTFMVTYVMQTAGLSRPSVLAAVILGTAVTPILVLASGALADRFGKRRIYLLGAAIALFGPQASFMAELFPAQVRSSGASLGFQIGGVLAGGLSPVIVAALVGARGGLLSAAGFLLILGAISLITVSLAPNFSQVLDRTNSSLVHAHHT